MFDKNYYDDKRNNLLKKRQIIFQKYLDGAFEFVSAVVEINKELNEIELWEKEKTKKEKETENPKIEEKK